jgi:membrane protease YdiL (CAAX protease family)
MELPLQTLILGLPVAIVVLLRGVNTRRWGEALEFVSWRGAPAADLLLGAGIGLLPGALMLAGAGLLPEDAFGSPDIANSYYAGWTPGLAAFGLALAREAFYVALGEELFFRGLLGGWLFQRWGFALGNLAQAAVFTLPHLLLLNVSPALWPLLPAQFAAGWLFGWLRHRSGSVLPGWVGHSLANAVGALAFMGS